jgi:hypothetical protein
VTVTLLDTTTNGYFIDTNRATGTVTMVDSSTTVSITASPNYAAEPNQISAARTSFFTLSRSDWRGINTNLTVCYAISGTASNGVDYVTLSNSYSFAPEEFSKTILVQPLADFVPEMTETVILTLLPNPTNADGYIVDPNHASALVNIQDTLPTNLFQVVANVNAPVGMDYYAPSNFLVLSYNFGNGLPYNFARIYTNLVVSNSVVITNVVVTNWTGISGLQDEVKLATVKTTAQGFTNGQMFFGNNIPSQIGRLSADGTVSNLNWATLTNDTYLRGGLYVDQSGSFGGT